jgi:predicted nucleic acid-binding protein
VLVSGVLSPRGVPRRVLEAFRAGAFVLVTSAYILVTGDKRDLLPLGRFGGVIIMAPSVFVRAVLQGG